MQLTVSEQEHEGLNHWYASKPKYPLHIEVMTETGHKGCITGIEQHFYGTGVLWRYKVTAISSTKPVSFWCFEEDITQVFSDILDVQETEDEEVISGQYVSGLDGLIEFLQRYGEKAIKRYHQTGVMRELRIQFWDAMGVCLD